MRIGILETGEVADDLRGRHGDYPAMFARILHAVDPALKFFTVSVVRGEMPAAPTDADGWIVTGSKHGVYDGLPWIAPLKAFLRSCLAGGVPVIGVCFGHQILAEAMGGRAAKSPKGWGVGVQSYEVVRRPDWMTHLPDRFAVGALHQDQVMEQPEGTTVLAASAFCEYAVLAYGDPEAPSAISVQAHPEFDTPFLDELISVRSGLSIPDAAAREGRASLGRPLDSAAWAELFVDYLREARAARPVAGSG